MKSVTIVAFGPSSKLKYDPVGEIWSMNNCLDIFEQPDNKHHLPRLTRIYEMHDMEKRWSLTSNRTGMPHFWHLDQYEGRVILQKPHPLIRNSESYPINEVETAFHIKSWTDLYGRDFWGGTPPYLLAHALLDGYDDIHLIGCDCLDPKHTRQWMPMSYLIGFAAARNITVTGHTVRSGLPIKRYGYDYGPEWDAEQNARLWDAYPYEVIQKGDMDWRSQS